MGVEVRHRRCTAGGGAVVRCAIARALSPYEVQHVGDAVPGVRVDVGAVGVEAEVTHLGAEPTQNKTGQSDIRRRPAPRSQVRPHKEPRLDAKPKLCKGQQSRCSSLCRAGGGRARETGRRGRSLTKRRRASCRPGRPDATSQRARWPGCLKTREIGLVRRSKSGEGVGGLGGWEGGSSVGGGGACNRLRECKMTPGQGRRSHVPLASRVAKRCFQPRTVDFERVVGFAATERPRDGEVARVDLEVRHGVPRDLVH